MHSAVIGLWGSSLWGSGPPSCLYSPECVEGEFSETRMQRSGQIIPPNRFCGAHPCFRVSKPELHVVVLNGYSLR
jgi:hypothetical protein